MKSFVPREIFPGAEVARIKAYMKREKIRPRNPLISLIGGTMTPGTPKICSLLSPASATPPGSSSVIHEHSPSIPQAALARGMTARPWNQVAREAAEKEATEKATSETQGKSYEEQWPRYVGPDINTADQSPFSPSDYPGGSIRHYCQLKFLALVINYPKELDDEPWNDSDADWYSSPPPPISFLVDIEVEAKIAQSNEDVKLWPCKI